MNGPGGRERHPALPVSPEEVARDGVRVAEAGADAVHLHPKGADGRDSMNPEVVAAHLTALREAAPGLPVGVTTGAWIESRPRARVALVRGWTVLPDFASVNWHEDGAAELAEALLERGVAVEAGLFHPAAAAAWASSGALADSCLRAMIELGDRPWPTLGDDLARMLALVGEHGVAVLVHGEERSCWPAVRYALRHGHQTRIGLEDTTALPDGRVAADNRDLVAAALGRSG